MNARIRSAIEGTAALTWMIGIAAIPFAGWWFTAWVFWSLGQPPDDHPVLISVLILAWLAPGYMWGRHGLPILNRLLRRSQR